MEFKVAQKLVGTYLREKQEAMKSGNPKESVAVVKDKWRKKAGCEGLVDSEKKAFELFKGFKENGYNFISRFLGGKNSASKQMEKEAGLALFGDEKGLEGSTLNEFHIMNGAVFCVRDFFRWVEAGMPDFERTSSGKLMRNDNVLKKAGVNGGVESKDELGNEKPSGEETDLWKSVKALLDDYNTDAIGLAKAIVGGSIREHQEDFQEIMLHISEYKKLIRGSNQNSDAFRTSAYEELDKLVEKIKELHAEPAISQFTSGERQSVVSEEVEEGRLPDGSNLHTEEKTNLIEKTRELKALAAECYDLADKVDDRKFKALFGKIIEAILKAESRQQMA
jgi:hypothetical protein